PLTFTVRHELWDGNIQDHPDQGVVILVMADVAGKETTLLRFNCFDFERSYIYGPENTDLRVEGPAMLGAAATTNLYRMDSTVDGNPIGWTIRRHIGDLSNLRIAPPPQHFSRLSPQRADGPADPVCGRRRIQPVAGRQVRGPP